MSYESMLIDLLCGRVLNVALHNEQIYIITGDMSFAWAIPLICPVCGQAWHIVGDDLEKKVALIRKQLQGFHLTHITYHARVQMAKVEEVLYSAFTGTSDVFDELFANLPVHMDADEVSVIGLYLRKKRRGTADDDMMLYVHPNSILKAVEIIGWKDAGW